jgi:hypothetical protein
VPLRLEREALHEPQVRGQVQPVQRDEAVQPHGGGAVPDLKRLKSRVFHAALTLFHTLFISYKLNPVVDPVPELESAWFGDSTLEPA